MIRLALLGHPVAHSRSPAMMRAALDAMGLEGAYVAFDVAPAQLGDAVRGLAALGFDGANVTVPHKVAVRAHLAAIDDAASLVGAVNTLVRGHDGWVGHNTDVVALVEVLAAADVALAGARAVVLGAGGAARAAAVGIARAGAARVDVAARRVGEAAEVAAVARAAGAMAYGHALGAPSVGDALAEATVVVQATPCGMHGGPDSEALLAGADLTRCAADVAAMDLVYAPAVTPWMRAAAASGLRVLEGAGAEMLARQGAAALARWTGAAAPLAVMRDALGLARR